MVIYTDTLKTCYQFTFNAAASKHGTHVYNVPFGAHYTYIDNQILSFN